MTIMLAERTGPALNELDHIVALAIPIDLARLMVPHLALAQDDNGIVWKGSIWDRLEGDCEETHIDYPSSPVDLRVSDGFCEVTTTALFGAGVLNSWILQETSKPMIVQFERPRLVLSCA